MERISCRSKPINSFVKIGVRPGKCRTVKSEQLVGLYLPKPFGLRGIVIFQGFAVMERLGTPNKQKSILEYCSSPVSESLLSEEDVVKKRAVEAQKQQEAKAAREKEEQERAAKFEELKSLKAEPKVPPKVEAKTGEKRKR